MGPHLKTLVYVKSLLNNLNHPLLHNEVAYGRTSFSELWNLFGGASAATGIGSLDSRLEKTTTTILIYSRSIYHAMHVHVLANLHHYHIHQRVPGFKLDTLEQLGKGIPGYEIISWGAKRSQQPKELMTTCTLNLISTCLLLSHYSHSNPRYFRVRFSLFTSI